MKVLFVITDYGSFNNFLAELAVSLSCKNEVHIVCSNANVININDKFDYNEFSIVFHEVDIPRSLSVIRQIKSALTIRKLIKLVSPRIVHAHFTTGILPTILFRKGNVEYWGTFHGLGMNASSGLRKFIFMLVETFCFIRLDRIYLINKKDFLLVKNIFKNKSFKNKSYGVGCDLVKFDSLRFSEEGVNNLRKTLKIDNKFVITYTGRFVEFKGFDLVYHSFKKINKEYPNQYVLLLIGGKDPIHHTGLTNDEQFELVEDRSIINIGYTSEVEKYLAISNVFLFPSKKEGLPVCIVESLAMGVPVISLDERGNADVVENGFNGYLIQSVSKKEDVNRIVIKLKYLFANKNILSELSKNCLINRAAYSRSLFIDEHIKLYGKLSD